MLLERLTISSTKGVIRDIPFISQGLNLVVDITIAANDATVSGNNVGKTTFMRSIDFCFGSSGKDIYTDRESKSENLQVKTFLEENEVTFKLSLIAGKNRQFSLTRSFNPSEDMKINGEKYPSLIEYNKKLNEIIFHASDTVKAVSFRNAIKKFVRSDVYSENSLYKILHHQIKDSTYEALYLFLFGFPDVEVIAQRLSITDKLASSKKELKRISGKSNLPRLESRLTQLESEILEKEQLAKRFDLPKTYDLLIDKLRVVKSRTSELSSTLGNLNTRINLSQKTIDELRKAESKIDPQAVRTLYSEAKALVEVVQKTFEEVLVFHNTMILNKLKFVENHIAKLEQERNAVKYELNVLLAEQSNVLRNLGDSGTFDDLIKVREEINVLYVEKGKLVSQVEIIQNIQQEIEKYSVDLDGINLTFDTYLEDLKKNIKEGFNKYFTLYTNTTHGEKLYVYYDHENRKFEFDNLEGNAGDGYKKTEIISFDLAFISYFNELGLDFPRFVLHDKFEIIHKNQIQAIFDIADSLNGQFFVCVLKERISFLGNEYIDSHKILELSQQDKYFRF